MNLQIRMAVIIMGLMAVAPAGAQSMASDGERLLTAVKKGDGAAATAIVEEPGSTAVNYRGGDGDAALHLVTRDRNTTWLGFLLVKGADPDIANGQGDTPLILAARAGYSEGVARLLMVKADVNQGNKQGVTPLIAAVQGRHSGIVRVLLKAGADPDKADYAAGFSARDYARRDTRSRELLQLIETVKPDKAAAKVGPSKP